MNEQDINDLLKVFDSRLHCYPLNVVDAIRFLVKQRDEARRDLCNLIGGFDVRLSRRAAKLRGWDCFSDQPKAGVKDSDVEADSTKKSM